MTRRVRVGLVRRLTGPVLIAVAMFAAGLAVVTAPAAQAETVEFERVHGSDRIQTAVAVSQKAFPNGASAAIVASSVNFPDALVGAYLAGQVDGPILLTHPTGLHDRVGAELDRLGVTDVYVLGGLDALSADVSQSLANHADRVQRIAGANRYTTAADVATTPPLSAVGTDPAGRRTALLASGENFADVLAAAPLAYNAAFPAVLTPQDRLHPAAISALDELEIERVIILGGPAAIGGTVATELGSLGYRVDRLAGANRFETSARIAKYAVEIDAASGNHVVVATGNNFPDALALAPLTATFDAMAVLVGSPPVRQVCALLGELDITGGHVVGGPAVIDAATIRSIHACVNAEPDDGDPVGGDPDPGEVQLVWSTDRIDHTAAPGSRSTLHASFTLHGDVVAPAVEFAGPAAAFLTSDPANLARSGDLSTLPVDVNVGDVDAGEYEGTITIRDGAVPVGSALPITIIVEPSSGIADEVQEPAAERIVTDDEGYPVVGDELIVVVDMGHPDPAAVANAVAAATDGTIIGSVPAINTYQIRYPGSTLDEVATHKTTAEVIDGVIAVSLNMIDLQPDAVPNDSEWDTWDSWETTLATGNNWALKTIRAVDGWDRTTGSSSIRVGVIDYDMDPDHGDLDDNVANNEWNHAGANGHGTHVAGTICAEGNNNRGVTGVMWDCELRYYSAGSLAGTVQEMVEAVDDRNRVINMSLQFIDNGMAVPETPDLLRRANDANNVFGQAVVYGQRSEQPPLWVFAAGNEQHRDVAYTAPAGLVHRFPTDTMAVAAIDRDGSLAWFSNVGEGVDVAAPGVDILSTMPRIDCWDSCVDDYATQSGTSMAAPHVAGLAGLVFADNPDRTAAGVKSCIVHAAQTYGAEVEDWGFHVIDVGGAIDCSGIVDLPAKVDIVLSFDLTGSMGGVVDQAKAEMEAAIAAVAAEVPGSDIRYAITSFEDYPAFLDGTACGSTYANNYGGIDDAPFRVESALSDDIATVTTTVNGLTLGDGMDGPESYGRALWEIAQPDTAATLGLRDDALTLIINFGDSIPHDLDLNEGILDPLFSGTWDTGVDPGRNGLACDDDDLDFHDDTLASLAEAGIRLLYVDSNWDDSLEQYWRTWASFTGGGYTHLGSSRPLSDVVIELLELI